MTTVQKLGNSFALIVTQKEARALGFAQGDKVIKDIARGKISFKKIAKEKPVYRIEDLLKGMTKKHLHKEVDWGYDIESENW